MFFEFRTPEILRSRSTNLQLLNWLQKERAPSVGRKGETAPSLICSSVAIPSAPRGLAVHLPVQREESGPPSHRPTLAKRQQVHQHHHVRASRRLTSGSVVILIFITWLQRQRVCRKKSSDREPKQENRGLRCYFGRKLLKNIHFPPLTVSLN